MFEAKVEPDPLPLGKFLGRYVAFDRQTFFVRLEILTDGHDVARNLSQIAHQIDDLFKLFAEAGHDAAFGEHRRELRVAITSGSFEKLKRLIVFRIGADAAIQTGNSLSVVIQYVGPRVQHIVQRRFVAVEIRDQNFDFALRVQFPHTCDRLGPVHRPAICEVVAIHRRDDRVLQIEMLYGFGNVCRLHRVEVHRLAFVHGAKSAMPRTCIAAEHESRGLIGPAFEDIRALCLLADGVKIQSVDQVQDLILVRRVAQFYLQPIRLFQPFTLFSVQK